MWNKGLWVDYQTATSIFENTLWSLVNWWHYFIIESAMSDKDRVGNRKNIFFPSRTFLKILDPSASPDNRWIIWVLEMQQRIKGDL